MKKLLVFFAVLVLVASSVGQVATQPIPTFGVGVVAQEQGPGAAVKWRATDLVGVTAGFLKQRAHTDLLLHLTSGEKQLRLHIGVGATFVNWLDLEKQTLTSTTTTTVTKKGKKYGTIITTTTEEQVAVHRTDLRVPVGLTYTVARSALDFFVEVVPEINFKVNETKLNYGVGVRYYLVTK
jgi:hypothetical protein